MGMHNHQKLDVWHRSYELAKSVYRSAMSFPSDERFGLAAQMKRSSVSIPSNIAEGSAQDSAKAFAHFLRIALGSAFELENADLARVGSGVRAWSRIPRVAFRSRRRETDAHFSHSDGSQAGRIEGLSPLSGVAIDCPPSGVRHPASGFLGEPAQPQGV